jgi:hypothetical protein
VEGDGLVRGSKAVVAPVFSSLKSKTNVNDYGTFVAVVVRLAPVVVGHVCGQ